MPSDSNVLGILRPMGGGDPIPLLKAELIIGRRPSCDICLDFANVSGKHCMLRLTNQVWHVRDLGSTNGTTLNGKQIQREESVMPDDELGVASHLFSVDYDPGAGRDRPTAGRRRRGSGARSDATFAPRTGRDRGRGQAEGQTQGPGPEHGPLPSRHRED